MGTAGGGIHPAGSTGSALIIDLRTLREKEARPSGYEPRAGAANHRPPADPRTGPIAGERKRDDRLAAVASLTP